MAELISPRLLIRVERSLRRRLNTDVMPHLLRCATHAHTEDEFMAAAARLLVDAQQRQRWLATWATRRHVDGGDTTPVDLDSTIGEETAAIASAVEHSAGEPERRANAESDLLFRLE